MICRVCNQEAEFYPTNSVTCKRCCAERTRQWQQRNRDRLNKSRRERMQEEISRQERNAYGRAWRAKRRALKQGSAA